MTANRRHRNPAKRVAFRLNPSRSDGLADERDDKFGDFELKEYFFLNETVAHFDQRLLTIKGWGVTLSLAALGFGFQYRSYGMFLLASISSLAFWALEVSTKRHQMRHYPRIREIEVNRCAKENNAIDRTRSVPRISWSWSQAQQIFKGELTETGCPQPPGRSFSYRFAWLMPHVALPHAFTLLVGGILFGLGCFDLLGGFTFGAAGE